MLVKKIENQIAFFRKEIIYICYSLLCSSDQDEQEPVVKNQRDELVNPFWIDDRDLKNGTIDFLPGSEQQFWMDLIEKYLEPEPFKTKEVVEKQKKTAEDLKTLRNQMVRHCFNVF